MSTTNITQGHVINSIGLVATQGQIELLKLVRANARPSLVNVIDSRDVLRKLQDALGLFVITPETLIQVDEQLKVFNLVNMEDAIYKAILADDITQFQSVITFYEGAISNDLSEVHLVRMGCILSALSYVPDAEKWNSSFFLVGKLYASILNMLNKNSSSDIVELISSIILYCLYTNNKTKWLEIFSTTAGKVLPVEVVPFWLNNHGDVRFAIDNMIDGSNINNSDIDKNSVGFKNLIDNAHMIFNDVSNYNGRMIFKLQQTNTDLYNFAVQRNRYMQDIAQRDLLNYNNNQQALKQIVVEYFTSGDYTTPAVYAQMGVIPMVVYGDVVVDALNSGLCKCYTDAAEVAKGEWKKNYLQELGRVQSNYDDCVRRNPQPQPQPQQQQQIGTPPQQQQQQQIGSPQPPPPQQQQQIGSPQPQQQQQQQIGTPQQQQQQQIGTPQPPPQQIDTSQQQQQHDVEQNNVYLPSYGELSGNTLEEKYANGLALINQYYTQRSNDISNNVNMQFPGSLEKLQADYAKSNAALLTMFQSLPPQ